MPPFLLPEVCILGMDFNDLEYSLSSCQVLNLTSNGVRTEPIASQRNCSPFFVVTLTLRATLPQKELELLIKGSYDMVYSKFSKKKQLSLHSKI